MSNLTGITKLDCATACNVDGCVIAAGRPQCMHPLKGGVPHHCKNDPAIQQLYGQACAVLGVRNVHEIPEGATP